MLRTTTIASALLCWISLGTASGMSSEASAPDEQVFTSYFANRLSSRLADAKVVALGAGKIEITSRSGASVELKSGLIREICLSPPNAWSACVDNMLQYYASFLRVAVLDEMLLRIANYVDGSWFLKTVPSAIPWKSRLFGNLQADCMKGAPDYLFPVTSWDGAALKTSADGLGAMCARSTQKKSSGLSRQLQSI